MAAEILAASSLNPNAKEFKPKTSSVEDKEEIKTLVKKSTDCFDKIPQVDGNVELIIENDSDIFDQDKNAISEKDEDDAPLCNRKLDDQVKYPGKRIHQVLYYAVILYVFLMMMKHL